MRNNNAPPSSTIQGHSLPIASLPLEKDTALLLPAHESHLILGDLNAFADHSHLSHLWPQGRQCERLLK